MKREVVFRLDGEQYRYFNRRINERCVEVALGSRFLSGAAKPIEVGNVMRPNEKQWGHDVIDLHEKRPGWKNYHNLDVLTWAPAAGQFDRALSLSTVEHTADPRIAIARILKWSPEVLITFPLGYKTAAGLNTTQLLMHGFEDSDLIDVSFMARHPIVDTGMENWRQVDRRTIMEATPEQLRWGQFEKPYHLTATAICILRKRIP